MSKNSNHPHIFKERPWRHKIPVALLFLSTTVSSSFAGVVKVTSINDNYDPNQSRYVEVHAGDVITFSADILDDMNNYQAMGASVESFNWQANDSDNDTCYASSSDDCLNRSNFQVTDYGVSFYVPNSMTSDVTITVSSQDPMAVDSNGSPTYDVVTLHNVDADSSFVPPQEAVTDPNDYPYDEINPDYALVNQGHWVVISGVRYWVPNTYVTTDDDEWAPYRHGYWSWDDDRGYTWISYDPWGWVTDHYGIWRHHGVYGWLWLPFEDRHYEPHCVSWFDNDDYTGWYPYFPGYSRGYAHGYNEGFVDGYWDGYQVGRGFGSDGYYYHPGFTMVRNIAFLSGDIVGVYERFRRGDAFRYSIVARACEDNRFGRFPGRAVTIGGARDFLSRRVGMAPITRTGMINHHRGVIAPGALRPIPDVYRQIPRMYGPRVPVGSVVDARPGHIGNGPRILPPTNNGRGVVAPPRVGGGSWTLPPRTQHPSIPNADNHSRPHANPNQPQPGNQPQPHIPVFDPHHPPQPHNPVPQPHNPVPQPHNPAPQPHNPAPPQPHNPAPQPHNPAPQPHNPAPQPHNPAPQPHNPVPQPHNPVPQPHNPVPQPHNPVPQPHNPVPPQPHNPAPPQPHNPAPPQPHNPAPPQPHNPAPAPQPHNPAPQPHNPAPAPQPHNPAPAPQPHPVPHNPAPQPHNPGPQPHPGGHGPHPSEDSASSDLNS